MMCRETIKLRIIILLMVITCISCEKKTAPERKTPVDYVNPYIGNISHLLVPAYPMVHLPNSMLRIQPLRDDFTGNKLRGLPVFLTGHRTYQAFTFSPFQGDITSVNNVIHYEYDHEIIKPYQYNVYLTNVEAEVRFAPSHQSGIYEIDFHGTDSPSLMVSTTDGWLTAHDNVVSGWQYIGGKKTKAYLYMETQLQPVSVTPVPTGNPSSQVTDGTQPMAVKLAFDPQQRKLNIRYGVSLISEEQAKKNLYREIPDYDLDALAGKGRDIWNEALGKIHVEGQEKDKVIFYTSLYRYYERMICISEDGKYYSGFDGNVHEDDGIPFYNDDWLWDTFLAAHPLRVILEPEKENHMLQSFVRMAEQMENFWLPTFPEVVGDTRRMFANHGILSILDGYEKGLRGFDLEKAYLAGKTSLTERTLAPWSDKKAGQLEQFYKENGYFPALAPGEKETVPEVDAWERRQPVAVSLGTAYDEWGLAHLARHLGKQDEYEYFLNRSFNYRKLFHPETRFFHPKDARGNFIESFDYRFSGGLGGRDAYDENNGWVYRWNVQHNISDLIEMMGGKEAFVDSLESMYDTPLGKDKYVFYSIYPDHTGNVGQFSMANEPALHIPYLYNYAGQPWRTQKRVRTLLEQWFRDDVMGLPGDEDGGGLTSFVVFSSLGFYPVTPGLPMYVIGSPVFEKALVQLPDNKTFEVICHNYSPTNKYIQSAKFNGKEWNKSWFPHAELIKGGTLELTMGKYPNKEWASSPESVLPSFKMGE